LRVCPSLHILYNARDFCTGIRLANKYPARMPSMTGDSFVDRLENKNIQKNA